MPELSACLAEEHGVKAAAVELSRFLRRRGFTHKKALMAAERERADVRDARRRWPARLEHMRRRPARLIFVDGPVTAKMVRLRGRAPRGERLKAPPRDPGLTDDDKALSDAALELIVRLHSGEATRADREVFAPGGHRARRTRPPPARRKRSGASPPICIRTRRPRP